MTRLLRVCAFIVLSLIVKWSGVILLGIMAIAKFKVFDYLFLVYPGTDSDLEGYCPPKLAKTKVYAGKPSWAGIITSGQAGVRGLYFVVPDTTDLLCKSSMLCHKIYERMFIFKKILKTKAIALAGRMPGIFTKQGLILQDPFVQGNKGTIFCVMETLAQVEKKHGLVPGRYNLVLAGVGYVGTQLMGELKSNGHYQTIGIDLKPNSNTDVILPEVAKQVCREADVVIVLTGKGSDFLKYKELLNPNCIIIDDTHPKIRKGFEEFRLYKVAVGMRGVRFFPALPGYRPRWIPGCNVEAIVASATGLFNNMSQEKFNQKAKELGFFAFLVR